MLFRHNPGAKAAAANKENEPAPLETDIKKALQDLSFLQRSSIFPGVSQLNIAAIFQQSTRRIPGCRSLE